MSQASALAALTAQELTWVIPAVAREIAQWRERALAIPPGPLRDDALMSLGSKRFHAEGAALFATLPRQRNIHLLRALVTIELLWDFLDTVSERLCDDVVRNGVQLHHALSDALDPRAPISDYYRHHPWRNDGGYLVMLVEACRGACAALPSFPLVQERAVRHAICARVCAINHEPSEVDRDAQLESWAAGSDTAENLPWFEVSAAASSSLAVHALLALAAEPQCDAALVARTDAAYSPWVTLACTMLDAYADIADDAATGHHNYLSHYPSLDDAAERLQAIVWNSAYRVRQLPRGERHAILATGMVAMYLSKDSACTSEMRSATRQVLRAAGFLPSILWPILRAWRKVTAQTAY
jgi:tetraprenyl-beta-curcumene synthase